MAGAQLLGGEQFHDPRTQRVTQRPQQLISDS
jgi:hypothetical protein